MHAAITGRSQRMQSGSATDAALPGHVASIQSIPGFGPAHDACLCAKMAALGSIDRRPASFLFGPASFDCDKDQHRDRGRILASWFPLSR